MLYRTAILVLLCATTLFSQDRVSLTQHRDKLITHACVKASDGKVALADLFRAAARMNGYDDSELRDALPECRVSLDSAAGRWTLRAFNRVMRPCVRAETSDSSLHVYVDRVASQEWINDCKSDVRWAWSKLDWRSDAPDYGITLLEDSDNGGKDIGVMIHGLNSEPEDLSALVPVIRSANLAPATFRYPNDQPIVDSAELLAQELNQLKNRFPNRRVRLLTHSMGGLVARAVIESELDPRIVSQLIMIAPPNHGSSLAKIAGLMDCYEFFVDPDKRRVETLVESVADGLGEATADLQPHSVFLDRLNGGKRNPDVRYTILLGAAGPMNVEEMNDLRGSVRDYTDDNRYLRFVTSKLNNALDDLDEVVQDKGDGAVSIARGRLEGASDTMVFPFSHASILNPQDTMSQSVYRVIARRLSATL